MNGQAPHRVVLSYGMGADSTALLLRWIREPATRPSPLDQLLVITAMTGDEWPVTGQLVAGYILPLLRAHGIRWVQVARSGPAQADGITPSWTTPAARPACSSAVRTSSPRNCSQPGPSPR